MREVHRKTRGAASHLSAFAQLECSFKTIPKSYSNIIQLQEERVFYFSYKKLHALNYPLWTYNELKLTNHCTHNYGGPSVP